MGTQDVRNYINGIQVIVHQLVALWSIFGVCTQQEKVYEVGGWR